MQKYNLKELPKNIDMFSKNVFECSRPKNIDRVDPGVDQIFGSRILKIFYYIFSHK
jgi:hypothetical protein